MSKAVKLAVVGAGSFVFGPAVLDQAIRRHRLDDLELVLMDVDAGMLDLMTATGRRMAQEAGVGTAVSSTTNRAQAVDGADFVICCAAPQMRSRHVTDRDIIRKWLPDHAITEFGGLAGLSYSLRQMHFVRSLAGEMTRLCPDAWLLDSSNPLPRVCQAAEETGIRTAGFCYYSLAGYHLLAHYLGLPQEEFPWTGTRSRLKATIAGLNHFCWVLELADAATGEDLLPRLRAILTSGATAGNPANEALSRQAGYLLLGADDHVASDFLPPTRTYEYHEPFHGNAVERESRLQALTSYAAGSGSIEEVMRDSAWEEPVAFVAGLGFGQRAQFHSLNLVNQGQITNLRRGVFVETECRVSGTGPCPVTVTLPEPVRTECLKVAEVTDAIVRAGRTRQWEDMETVIELDPTVVDKANGLKAAREIVQAHADMIGDFE